MQQTSNTTNASAATTAQKTKEELYKTAKARIACAHFTAGQFVAVEYYGGHYFKCAANRENLSDPNRSAVYPQHHLTEFCL